MKKFMKNTIPKVLVTGLVLTLVLSACVVSHAAKTADNHFWCGGYYVGYNDSMSATAVNAKTGFDVTLTAQRTGVNINTVIKKTDGTGATKAGTAVHNESTKSVSGKYSCPDGYKVTSASIKHSAQANNISTASKSVTLN